MVNFVISGPGAPTIFNCVRFLGLLKAYTANCQKNFKEILLEGVKEIGSLS